MLKTLIIFTICLSIVVFGYAYIASAAPTYNVFRSLIPEADNLYYIGTSSPSNLRYNGVFNTITVGSCTGCGSSFPFTVTSYGVSTSTTIGLLNGFLSTASSTIDASSTVTGVLTASGNIFTPNITVTGTTRLGTFTGILGATAGVVTTASAGSDYEVPLTFSTGLTRSVNTITVDQSFSPTWTGAHIFNNITRSTTTQATSTNLFTTTASTTNFFGADLATCNSTTGKLTWAAGKFGCGTDFNTGMTTYDAFTHPSFGLSATTSQLLIGTSTASNYQLTISSSTAPQISLSSGADLAQWVFRNAGGNLYIATTTVAGTATTSTSIFNINGSTGSVGFGTDAPAFGIDLQSTGVPMRQIRFTSTAAAGSGILIAKARGSQGNPTIVQSGDKISTLNFAGYDGSGTYSQTAGIESYIDATPGVGDMPGRLIFLTTPDGSVAALERIRIDNAGNVGIGTTSPWRTFSVTGTVGLSSSLGTESGVSDDALCIDTTTFEMERNSGATTCLLSLRETKNNIVTIETRKALERVLELNPVDFSYKIGGKKTKGFIAEDLEMVDTRYSTYDPKGKLTSYEPSAVLADVVGAIKEIWRKVLNHESRIEQLEKENKLLKERLDKLENNE